MQSVPAQSCTVSSLILTLPGLLIALAVDVAVKTE